MKYDFGTKMRLNAFVIDEIANALHPSFSDVDRGAAQNAVAVGMSANAELHGLIGKLSEAMKSEVDRQRSEMDILPSLSERVAAVWLHGRR